MMSTTELYNQIEQLPLQEQIALIQQVLSGLAQQMPAENSPKQLQSLLGLWQGFTVTEEDIAKAR